MNFTNGVLQLTRPLIAVDVETHDIGTPETLRVVELGFHIEYPDGREPKTWCKLFNPGRPIAPGATNTHGISDADVEEALRFEQIASNLAKGFTDCDFCGYNIQFDMRVIQGEMVRAGVRWSYTDAHLFDPLKLWQLARRRTLSDAVEEFLGRPPTSAHRALGDAQDALEVGIAMLQRFNDLLPRDIKKLHQLAFDPQKDCLDPDGKFKWRNGTAVITFGKFRDTPLQKIDRGYLEWICRGEFNDVAKLIARNALAGKYPSREPEAPASSNQNLLP